MSILELRDVHRVHGRGETAVHALRGVTLTVGPGELVAVMGPSGSGKSTLLNLAGGLDAPTGGEVAVEGEVLGGLSRRALAAVRRRRVGYVFQDLNLLPSLTAAENVAPAAGARRHQSTKDRQLALAALEEVGLAPLAPRFPDELSGGQQQRVAIARALVGDRRLVLADEPTGALDSQTGEAVLKLLRARVDAGAAGVLVTHEARHAAWADRVVFLRDGEMVDTAGPVAGPRICWRAPREGVADRAAHRAARGPARPGRSLLVIAMIGLPVLFLAFAAASYDMFTPTGAEAADRTMGTASARVQWSSRYPVMQLPDPYEGFGSLAAGPSRGPDDRPPPTTEELVAALGPGTRAIPLGRGSTALRTAAGIGELGATWWTPAIR
jgi:putative ABC transport system ATP-binding protein